MSTDYRRYVATNEVEARQLDEDETVVTANGAQAASKGDYAVRDQSGALRVVAGEEFDTNYRAVGSSPKSGSKST
jgi:hypothetical protein